MQQKKWSKQMHAIELAYERWKQDPSTIDELLRRLTPLMRGWAGNELSAARKDYTEDVAQMALISVWERLDKCDGHIMGFAKVACRFAAKQFAGRLRSKGRDFTQLIDDYYEPAPAPRHREYSMPELTEEEQSVCDQIRMGFTQGEIAEMLGINPVKVRDILTDVRRKCGTDVPDEKTRPGRKRISRGPRNKYQHSFQRENRAVVEAAYSRYLAGDTSVDQLLVEWRPSITKALSRKMPLQTLEEREHIIQLVMGDVKRLIDLGPKSDVWVWIVSLIRTNCGVQAPKWDKRMSTLQTLYEQYRANPDCLNDLLVKTTKYVATEVGKRLPSYLQAHVDDVTQIVILEVWRRIPTFRTTHYNNWLKRIAKSRCLGLMRQQTGDSKLEAVTNG
jgi:DNA-directed RNA polymerase specialized sigma24 family protein